jgi:hypothetical protein
MAKNWSAPIFSISSTENPPGPPGWIRQWREFAGLSREEMTEKLSHLGIQSNRSAGYLDNMERAPGQYTHPILEGYVKTCGCTDVEIIGLASLRGSIYAMLAPLTSPHQVQLIPSSIERAYRARRGSQ